MKRAASTGLWIALLLGPGAAAAATPGAPDTLVVRVPGVEVTALRGRDPLREIPAATFVLSSDDIRRAGSPRLATLLQSVPGLYAYGQTSNGDATIVDPRGFTASGESSYLKLLVDGQDVRDLENGNVDWDWVAPVDVQRVEIVQGPGAWIYGDASEGGIVNLVRAPMDGPFATHADARAGSFGLRSGGLTVSGPWGPARLGLRGLARDVDGWRDHSRERVYGGGGEALARWGSRELTLDASALDTHRQDPGALTAEAFAVDPSQADSRIDYTRARRGRISARLGSVAGAATSWGLTPYLRLDDVDQVRTLFFDSQFHPTRGTTAGGRAEWRKRASLAGRPVEWQAEAEGEHGTLRSEYFAFDPATGRGARLARTLGRRTTGSASAGARLDLDARTVLRLSARGDLARVSMHDDLADTTSRSRTMTAFTPLLGITRRVGDGGSVYLSGSTAFRVPTLFQLYDLRPFTVAPGFTVSLSNPGLDPQRASSLETGARWDGKGGASAQLACYSTWVRNEIDFDLATLRYANISRSWHRGVEAQAEVPLPARLTMRLGGAVTPTTFDGGDFDGNQINGVPLGTGSASLAWSPVSAASADVGARLIGRQFLDKMEERPLGSATVWDAGVQGRAGRFVGTLRVLNVFDKRFADSGFVGALGEDRLLPAAPRSYNVTLTLE